MKTQVAKINPNRLRFAIGACIALVLSAWALERLSGDYASFSRQYSEALNNRYKIDKAGSVKEWEQQQTEKCSSNLSLPDLDKEQRNLMFLACMSPLLVNVPEEEVRAAYLEKRWLWLALGLPAIPLISWFVVFLVGRALPWVVLGFWKWLTTQSNP